MTNPVSRQKTHVIMAAGKIIFCGFQEIPGLFKNLDYFT